MKVPPFLSTKDKIFESDEYTRDLDTAFVKVREALQRSQERQKKAADRHRHDLKLKKNDWVLLRFEKARLRKKKGKERLYPKLSMRYYGPFQITEQINDVSLRLRLPDTWRIHNAFHVSLLKPFRGDALDDGEPDEQPVVKENEEILAPEQILAHKDTKTKVVIEGDYNVFKKGCVTILRHLSFGANPARVVEWKRFLTFLSTYRKVAYVSVSGWELLINPPFKVDSKQAVVVSYRLRRNFIPPSSYVPFEPVCQNASVPILAPAPAPVPAPIVQESKRFSTELIDNARDAKATSRLDISVDQEFSKAANSPVPVLSVRDNGTGMTHSEILRMMSFGHKKPDEDDESLIGRFGVGFKTGSMRLGKDVVVLTQSAETRSIAFLSQTYNKGKEVVEIPVITYRKEDRRLKSDIWIRSRRVRARPCQMTKSVPLDYSLHAYLEMMFLEPKMKIYVQGTLVRTRRLHKSLNKTRVFKDTVLGKRWSSLWDAAKLKEMLVIVESFSIGTEGSLRHTSV
ncbi:hypothetical protein L7F22_004759 [Adiantum nelumboides]|nr:hypothetical protein [Adiantum nelumboides]